MFKSCVSWRIAWITHSCTVRSNPPEVFFWKNVTQICNKFTGERPCWRLISMKLLCNFIESYSLAWVFSCQFVTYFQNTFLLEVSGRLLIMVICWLKKWYHCLCNSERQKEFLCLLNFFLLIISFKFMQHLKSCDCVYYNFFLKLSLICNILVLMDKL